MIDPDAGSRVCSVSFGHATGQHFTKGFFMGLDSIQQIWEVTCGGPNDPYMLSSICEGNLLRINYKWRGESEVVRVGR